MKKINQYKFIAGVFAVSLLASCNYEEINTNPFELTDEEGIMDGVAVGGLITTIERTRLIIICPPTAGAVSSGKTIPGQAETVM